MDNENFDDEWINKFENEEKNMMCSIQKNCKT